MELLNEVRASLFEVIDPELGVNIMDLGLIYGVLVDDENNVIVRMTLTTPGCPLHDSITKGVEYRIQQIKRVRDIKVELIWDPPWSPARMTDRCKEFLGLGR